MWLVEPVERERFGGGRKLIRQRDKVSFDIGGRHRGHREHMVFDAVAFDVVEVKILQSVHQGRMAMGEAVPRGTRDVRDPPAKRRGTPHVWNARMW